MEFKEAQELWIKHYDQWNEAFERLREVNAQISAIMKANESRVKSGILNELRVKSNEFDRLVQVHQNEMDSIIQSLD